MSAHKHRWQRLSDVALFCECGQTKEVDAPAYPVHLCSHPCTLPHYPPYGWWSPTIYPTVYYPTWTGDTSGSIGSTSVVSDDSSSTYTAIG